jgi:hypothetical protein
MHRTLLGVTAALAFAAAAPARAQAPRPSPTKQATAHRADPGAIHLDGRLDEEAWLLAEPIIEFVQKEPDEGAPPTDAMDVRFIYDNDALYVGARLSARDPSAIAMPTGRRDEGDQAEHLLIELDSYFDHRTAYAFGVTASGVRLDHVHPSDNEGDFDTGFDPIWEARVHVDQQGWTAEMWIPFSQLRFNLRDQQVWGLNVYRWIPPLHESDYWVAVPRTEQGWSSRFGELRGIDNVRPKQRLEVLPYLAGGSTLTGNRDPRNPFDDGRNLDGRAGADVKIGFGSNLTLDATVNPDFGQVEADPAEVNLSAFETFFTEKRPFFVEGSGLLLSRVENFFYSRRIGAAPAGAASGDFVDYPKTSTILGAAKLTGRLPSKTSVGMLAAVTAGEDARTFDLATLGTSLVPVAPRTTYAVARVQQEFGAHASTAAVMATFVHRDLQPGAPLASLLTRNAVTLSGDSVLQLKGGEYEMVGGAGVTVIDGDAQAIDRVQRNSTHYFQRPDREYGVYDPARTSMLGATGYLSINRKGGRHWLWGASSGQQSPEYDPNALGRLSTADGVTSDGWIRYRETQPGRYLRNYYVAVEQTNEWNYGGDLQSGNLQAYSNLTWLNFWSNYIRVSRDFPAEDERLTRGGPLMQRPGGWTSQLELSSPTASRLQGNAGVQYTGRDDGGLSSQFYGGFSVRPRPQWKISINPTYLRQVDFQQYVSTLDGGGPATYGQQFVFAHIDRSTYSMQLRVNYTIKPDLTLDLYAEPFATSGRYSDFGELAAARSSLTDPIAGALSTPPQDFNVQSFRTNVVLRWEWRPGSTFYAVWQQNRAASVNTPDRVSIGDMFRSVSVPGDNVVALKASFWLSMK